MQPTIKLGLTTATAYGKSFSFPRRGETDHYRGRDAAYAEAMAYGRQVLEAMKAQKGAPLTNREIITGRLDEPAAAQPVMHLRPPEPHPDQNPYAARLAELQSQRPLLAADRGRLARRVEAMRSLHDDWETTRAAERIIEARNADEKVKIMREHAEAAFDHARLDSRARPDEVSERRRLLDFANSDSSQPGDYWKASDAADDRWFKRLDDLEAEKRAAVDAAKAELAEARGIAKAARKVDPVAEQAAVAEAEQLAEPMAAEEAAT